MDYVFIFYDDDIIVVVVRVSDMCSSSSNCSDSRYLWIIVGRIIHNMMFEHLLLSHRISR